MVSRRNFLVVAINGMAAATVLPQQAEAFLNAKKLKLNPLKKILKSKVRRPVYAGRIEVQFSSPEKPGTLIINTDERALYKILGKGKALRYLVAVGKEGFSWAGVAKVGMKRENPVWTPPPEMIDRKPEYAKWADGMNIPVMSDLAARGERPDVLFWVGCMGSFDEDRKSTRLNSSHQ